MPRQRLREIAAGWLLACIATLAVAAPASAAGVQANVEALIRNADLRNTKVSIVAIDLTHQRLLVSINPDAPMIPASNMKLITSAAALDLLGPDFVFRTRLSLIPPEGGTSSNAQPAGAAGAKLPGGLPGGGPSLLVAGDGDPAFGDPKVLAEHDIDIEQFLNQWVAAAVKTGYKRFDRIIIDDRIFDAAFVQDSWPVDQLNRWYCAEVSGLNFHTNCLDVYPSPSQYKGAPPRVELKPLAPFVQTENKARTGSDDTFWISRRHNTNDLAFHGVVRTALTKPVPVTVHDPPMFFGQLLRDRLKKQGVEVGEVVRVNESMRLDGAKPILVVQSTLPLVLARVNQDSQNLYAESLIKRVGRKVTGQPGSWENGAAAVRIVLRQRLGAAAAAIQIADGSGMSRDNQVTARLLTALLESMFRDKDKGPIYFASLSEAGESGTLDDRLENVPGELHGKTGYLRSVSSLSGYLLLRPSDLAPPGGGNPASDDEPVVIVFSMLFNDFSHPVSITTVRAVQDRIVRELSRYAVEQMPQPAGR